MVEGDGAPSRIGGSHLLIAIGRAANVQDLGLDEAGVRYSPRGVEVDARLRSSNKKIFAIGDVAGGYQFTHVAGYHAGIVIRNALFRLPAKADHSAVPWVTYTDPELATVGLSEAAARDASPEPMILRAPFEEIDRARAERRLDGLVKVVVGKRGRVLGASIVGPHAGELILPWVFAVQGKLKIKDMASVIAPYPTLSEVSKRVAGSFYTPSLFSSRTRWIVRTLLRLG
jgi:pyruvate/2-oxoglutarate dehydrogenase complex dihydrolipoamide dehydrogenase (E3) component